MDDRYLVPDENKKILCVDANDLYCQSKSQPLPFGEMKFNRNIKLEEILNTLDHSNIG